jgi:hypothetical protein
MRIPIRPARSRVLAIAASVLLSGAALAAATSPAQAATVSAGHASAVPKPAVTPAPTGVTVTNPGPTTEPLQTAITLPLTATDSDTAGYPLIWSATGLAASGLTIAATNTNGTDAAITGTVSVADAGTYAITVTATDSEAPAVAGTATFELTLANTVTVTKPAAQTSPPGTAIKPLAIVAKDTDADATLTYSAAKLPTGLVIDPTTGVITGKPTADGTYDVVVTVTDSTGATGMAAFTWSVGKIVVTAPAKTQVYTGVAVDIKPKATDTAAKPALAWSDSGLPPGLSSSKSTGAITGRPSKAGKYDAVKLTATDTTTKAASTLTVAIVVSYPFDIFNPGTKTTTVGQGLDVGFGYAVVLKGIKVTSLSARNLPAGMGVSGNPARLYGWAAKAGTYNVVINGSGTSGATSTMTFKLVVKAAPNSGPTGQVALAHGGKCLLDPGGRTANGTKAEVSNCVSGSTEKWTVAADATLRVNGRCLDISGTGGYSGRVAELWSCNGSAREQWTQGTDGELVNPASGVCLTDPSTKNGTVAKTGACHTTSNEQWSLPAQPILASLGGTCADDFHSIGSDGAEVDVFSCNGTRGQGWVFRPNGTISIIEYPADCLTVRKSKIQLWVCGTSSGQNWTVARAGTMSSELKDSGVCLGIPSLTAGNGTALIAAKCTASDPRVHWHIG